MLVRLLELLILRAKISFQQMLIYRIASSMIVIFGVLFVIAEYLAIDVYFSFGETIGDWSRGEYFILFGSFNCMIYLYSFFFEIGHDDFAYKIKYGELDYELIRPVDSMFLCSFSRFDFPSLLNLILPSVFIYRGLVQENITLNFLTAAGFLLAIFIGTFVIYLLNHILTTLFFWLTDFSNSIQILNSLIHLGSKPLNIYPIVLQFVFGFCIPIILAGNLPADIILGKVTIQKLGVLCFGASILYILTRILWLQGLKKYASASS